MLTRSLHIKYELIFATRSGIFRAKRLLQFQEAIYHVYGCPGLVPASFLRDLNQGIASGPESDHAVPVLVVKNVLPVAFFSHFPAERAEQRNG